MNNDTEHYFDKILLFKPQGNMTYIRKLSMSYGYYTALAVVNKYDTVTYVGANNDFNIIPFGKLNNQHRKLLGAEKCSTLKPDDLMSIYEVKSPLKLKKDYHLLKPCRNMRYSLPEETYNIKKRILHTLSAKHNVDLHDAQGLSEYVKLYQKDMALDFTNVIFNIDKDYHDLEISIPTYNSVGAFGQTKLI